MIDSLIRKGIENNHKFSFEDIIQLQLNQQDAFLCEVLPKFLGKLTLLKKLWSNPQTEALFAQLLNWNCNITKDSVPAAIYHVWEQLFL